MIMQGKLKELCLSVQENSFISSSVMTQIGGKLVQPACYMEAVDKETVKQIL